MTTFSDKNGEMPASQLTVVQQGMELRTDSAIVFKAMRSEANSAGYPNFGIAYDAGAYRDLALQKDMKVHPAAHNISKASSIGLASPGLSSHGWGDRFDLVGAPLNYIIALANRYGCIREFGSADPNHFQDMHRWKPIAEVPQTTTEEDGKPGVILWKRMQLLARAGGYNGPINGKMDAESWEGVQQFLKGQHLYYGDVDGDPGVLTFTALQQWCGVQKPILTADWKKITVAAWKKIAKKLNTL